MTGLFVRVQQVIPAPKSNRRPASSPASAASPESNFVKLLVPYGVDQADRAVSRAVRQANPQPASSLLDPFPSMTLTAYLGNQGRRGPDPSRPWCRAAAVQGAYTTIIAIYEPASPNTPRLCHPCLLLSFVNLQLSYNEPFPTQSPFKICP